MNEYKIIALGGSGGQICKALLSQGVNVDKISYFHTDQMIVKYLDIKDKFLVGEETGLCRHEVTKELVDKHCDLFECATDPDVLYILTCGLGGRTGTGLIVNLSKLLVKKNRKFVIVVTIPCRMEGIRKMEVALSALSELVSLPDKNVIPLPIDDMITPGLSMFELFDRVDRHVVVVIKGILMKFEVY